MGLLTARQAPLQGRSLCPFLVCQSCQAGDQRPLPLKPRFSSGDSPPFMGEVRPQALNPGEQGAAFIPVGFDCFQIVRSSPTSRSSYKHKYSQGDEQKDYLLSHSWKSTAPSHLFAKIRAASARVSMSLLWTASLTRAKTASRGGLEYRGWRANGRTLGLTSGLIGVSAVMTFWTIMLAIVTGLSMVQGKRIS